MNTSPRQAQPRIVFALVLFFLSSAILAQGPKAAVPSEHHGADRFFLKNPGQKISVEGKVYHRERLLRASEMTSTVLAPEKVEGRDTVVHEMVFAIHDARGRALAEGVRVKSYSLVDRQGCATFAIQPQGKPLEVKQHLHKDLQVPIKEGGSWTFKAFGSLSHPRMSKVNIDYTTTITQTGVSLDVAGQRIEGCIHVEEVGRVVERPELVCIDGTRHKVRILIERSRWFCPGLGSVREDGKQLYSKDTPGAELCDLTSDHFEVVTVVNP